MEEIDPPSSQTGTVWQHVIVRWFHALVWVLLAASCFAPPSQELGGSAVANVLALLLALVTCAMFVDTLLVERITAPLRIPAYSPSVY